LPAVTASIRIDTIPGRARLAKRREPHWSKYATGRYIGFRKTGPETGSWIARHRAEDGTRQFRALGALSREFGFDEAVAAAVGWFRALDRGTRTDVETVTDVCRLYVEDRRQQKGPATATDYQRAFERSVYGGGGKDGTKHAPSAIGGIPLPNFRRRHLLNWRDDLVARGMTRSTANRMRTRLVAALNFAVHERYVGPEVAIEWQTVEPFKGASKRRDLYLDLEQRRALLAAAAGAVRDLIEAAAVTGARAGELVSARRSQFDGRQQSITLSGKTGSRTIPLPPAAVTLFRRLANGKLPGALLLTRDDGKAWQHSDWDGLVRAAAAKAGLPPNTCLYTLRHSFITQAITDGMSVLETARLVGTSIAMIDKHYGHLALTTARERLARLQLV
jgi:integrase